MNPDEMPDYANYSLADLYDVASRIDRTRYADRYARVLQEIERKNGAPLLEAIPPKPHGLSGLWRDIPPKPDEPWRDWLFRTTGNARTPQNIVGWWEQRREFWNFWVTLLFGSSATTCVFLLLFAYRNDIDFSLPRLAEIVPVAFTIVLWSLLFWVFALIAINIVFCIAYLFDIVLNVPLRVLGWRLSVALFSIPLVLTIAAAVFPIIRLIVFMMHQ